MTEVVLSLVVRQNFVLCGMARILSREVIPPKRDTGQSAKSTRSRQSAQDRGAKSSARTCAGALETNRQPWMRQTPSRRPSRRTRSCTPPCPASRSSDPLLPPHCCVWPAFPQRPEYAHRVCPDRAALDVQGAKLFVRCFRRSAVPVCAPSRTLISPAQPYPMHWHRCR
jgi:hypothetical protein